MVAAVEVGIGWDKGMVVLDELNHAAHRDRAQEGAEFGQVEQDEFALSLFHGLSSPRLSRSRRNEYIQGFCDRLCCGVPVMLMGAGTDGEFHAIAILPDVLGNPLGRVPIPVGNRSDGIPWLRAPQETPDVVTGSVGVTPLLKTQAVRIR